MSSTFISTSAAVALKTCKNIYTASAPASKPSHLVITAFFTFCARDLCCAWGRSSNSSNLIAVFIYVLRCFEVQSWIIVVSKSDINFRSSPVSPHAKAKWWQMQCILNIPLHSSSSLNLTLSHYLSQSLLYYLFPVTPLSFPVITLAPSEQNSINSSKFKPKLFSTTFLRHKKIYKASADLVSDSPKISHELRNLHTVIPSSIS